ncbi:hypothetical protein [Pseudoponticoccus marisrubri]|uniref:Bacteriophage tail tape measure C-terminal domain-containing protein n=1 Tax=Pseudoponticoccus marisrubri TaxID=1685382 RepID=A0A0W7WP72_9RHOB|nr:hypothetical protein [Pseudoponticoccus marisrubri]KUF12402.1 hypothetical protein AVJ23_01335 [Pseudoponticoccus marisrubri]
MPDVNLPGLVVDLEAKIDKLEKGLAKANRAQRRSADQMERRAKQSADRINSSYGAMASRVTGRLAKMAAPVAATLGSAATVRAMKNTARAVAQIGDEAKRAGVPLEAFQEWRFVAEQNRISADALTDGLKELSLRTDEFIITGAGPAAEALQRLGFGAEELREKLQDPSELMLEIIARTRRLDRAAQIRIADEVFGGTGGEQFVQLLARGEDELRRTIDRAHEVGAVLDQEMIEKADEVSRKFDEITARVSALGKSVVVNVAGAIEDALTIDVDEIFGSAERAAAMMGQDAYDAMKGATRITEDQRDTVEGLQATYEGLFRAINAATGPDGLRLMDVADIDEAHELAGILQDIDHEMRAFQSGKKSAAEFEKTVGDLIGEAQNLIGELDEVDAKRFGNVIEALGGIARALAVAAGEAAKLRQNLPTPDEPAKVYSGRGGDPRAFENGRTGPLAPTTSLRPKLPSVNHSFGVPDPEPASPGGGGGGGGSGGAPKLNNYEAEIADIREETVALELEAAALVATAAAGRTFADAIEQARREAELLHAAQRAGIEITPQVRAEIEAEAASYSEAARAADAAAAKIEGIQEAREQVRSAAKGAFTDLITGATTLDSALQRVIGRLAEMAASRVFDRIFTGSIAASGGSAASGGGLLGFVGGLLGFAGGGFTGPGARHEPAGIVHRGEFVVSKPAVERIGVDQLERLHEGALRGYAAGGLVGGASAPKAALAPVARSSGDVNISAPVTVNGSAGSPEQNADLAKKMAREMENSMKQIVVKEIRQATRPGNMLGS